MCLLILILNKSKGYKKQKQELLLCSTTTISLKLNRKPQKAMAENRKQLFCIQNILSENESLLICARIYTSQNKMLLICLPIIAPEIETYKIVDKMMPLRTKSDELAGKLLALGLNTIIMLINY